MAQKELKIYGFRGDNEKKTGKKQTHPKLYYMIESKIHRIVAFLSRECKITKDQTKIGHKSGQLTITPYAKNERRFPIANPAQSVD